MNEIVAHNIKKLRTERKLSLEELATASGVSKSMLAQIERGAGNPTLSTLWKISNGLDVPFDFLIARVKPETEVITLQSIQPILENDGKVRNYSIFPDDEQRHFSVYYLEVEAGGYWQSAPHYRGTREFVTVLQGTLKIGVNDTSFMVHKGESIRFRGDREHSYCNLSDEMMRMYMILYTI